MNGEALEALNQARTWINRASAALNSELDPPEPTPPIVPDFRVAVVVGHEPTKPGATNKATGLSEFKFNDWIADQMLDSPPPGIELVKVHRHPGTYSQLPAKVNALNPDLVISLHCNGYDGEATGTEMLYAEGSTKGKRFAELLQAQVVSALQLRNRGVKPRKRRDRGGHILNGTKAPAVIVEPFFLDNDSDLQRANERLSELIAAYLKAIAEFRNLWR